MVHGWFQCSLTGNPLFIIFMDLNWHHENGWKKNNKIMELLFKLLGH